MNAQNAKDYLPLVLALAEGSSIQVKIDGWKDDPDPDFKLPSYHYRIKQEPRRWWIGVPRNRDQCEIPYYRAYPCPQVGLDGVIDFIEVVEVTK